MQKINGHYTSAVIYSHTAEAYALSQVQAICDNEAASGSKICVMPDVHPGKAGPIGLTMTIGNQIMPYLLGVDIGCGITYIQIKERKIEYQKVDTVIRDRIPTSVQIRKEPHLYSQGFDFTKLLCRKHIHERKALLSLGTLGGGNHFLELDKDREGNIYAVAHSGSRHLGVEVTEFYLREGQKQLKRKGIFVPYELTYLEGELRADYLHDLLEVQKFASLNREIILSELSKYMKWKVSRAGECIHNYVDGNGILRKGAVSAYQNEEVIIPINMRDGIILGIGKGNPEWNYSAPHGGGRILKREDVRARHTLSEYKTSMKGIYSPTVSKETLDEAPFAYREIDEILGEIAETVEVKEILKPIYNYKGTSKI